MEQTQNLLTSDLQVDEISQSHLRETAKWAKFLGIIGFIFSSLIGLASFFIGSLLTSRTRYNSDAATLGAGMVTVIYLVIAVLYFILSLYLFRFAVKMQSALLTINQDEFNDSLLNLKRLYKIMGILTVIYLSLIVLALLVSILSASVNR